MRHGYRARILTHSTTRAAEFRRSLRRAALLPPKPRILRVGGAFYANRTAMDMLRKLPTSEENNIGQPSFAGRYAGIPIEPMPAWMEGTWNWSSTEAP